mmetsp:Transcript_5906/g.8226  ORF Transcript_5906/g.8226 Transcript_5906/m.8226 type:complete len:229 (+) Transcript_5906:365-1051(+)
MTLLLTPARTISTSRSWISSFWLAMCSEACTCRKQELSCSWPVMSDTTIFRADRLRCMQSSTARRKGLQAAAAAANSTPHCPGISMAREEICWARSQMASTGSMACCSEHCEHSSPAAMSRAMSVMAAGCLSLAARSSRRCHWMFRWASAVTAPAASCSRRSSGAMSATTACARRRPEGHRARSRSLLSLSLRASGPAEATSSSSSMGAAFSGPSSASASFSSTSRAP